MVTKHKITKKGCGCAAKKKAPVKIVGLFNDHTGKPLKDYLTDRNGEPHRNKLYDQLVGDNVYRIYGKDIKIGDSYYTPMYGSQDKFAIQKFIHGRKQFRIINKKVFIMVAKGENEHQHLYEPWIGWVAYHLT